MELRGEDYISNPTLFTKYSYEIMAVFNQIYEKRLIVKRD